MGDATYLAYVAYMTEDTYYYLTIARNFMHGLGLTLDGQTWTNGYHPLHMLLLLPGARLGEWAFVQYAMILSAAYRLFAGIALYKLLESRVPRGAIWLILALWFSSHTNRLLYLNGMETGLFVFLWLLTFHVYLIQIEKTKTALPEMMMPGLCLGLAFWGRSDAVFLGGALVMDLFFRYRKQCWKPALKLFVVSVAVVLPWWAMSYAMQGHITPDSGPATADLTKIFGVNWTRLFIGQSYEWDYLWELSVPAMVRVKTGLFHWFAAVVWTPPFALEIGKWHGLNIWNGNFFFRYSGFYPLSAIFLSVIMLRYFWKELKHHRNLQPLLAAALLLLMAYFLLPGAPWYTMRYTTPLQLVLTMAMGLILWRWFSVKRWGRILLLVGAAYFGYHQIHHYRQMFPHAGVRPDGYAGRAQWVKETLPKDAVLGVPQAGYMSYFSGLTTINLDGVVNRQALEARREGRMIDYILEKKIDYILDGRDMIVHMISKEDPERFKSLFIPLNAPTFEIYWNPAGGTVPPLKALNVQVDRPQETP